MTLKIALSATTKIVPTVSPLSELVACLHLLDNPGHHVALNKVIAENSARVPKRLESEFQLHSPLWGGYFARFFLPDAPDDKAGLEVELKRLEMLSTERWYAAAAWAVRGSYRRSRGNTSEVALSSQQLLSGASARGPMAVLLARKLLDDPEGTRQGLVALLREFDSLFFGDMWPRLSGQLASACSVLQARIHRDGFMKALLSIDPSFSANGTSVLVEKDYDMSIDADHSVIVVVPTILGWPHFRVKYEPNWNLAIHFPITEYRHLNVPTLNDVENRLRALSDAPRIQLCRLIAVEPHTTTALAARMGMTTPQVSRHLKVLRDARLVRRRRDGHLVYYELNFVEFASIGSDLLAALLRI